MCGYCKAEDAQVCTKCGVLVADGYQQEHSRQHPHSYEAYPNGEWGPTRGICLMCRLPESATVHQSGEAATPADAHALVERAERQRNQFAWLHQCGRLNHGYWHKRSVCGGCRFSVEHAEEVEAHYRLVPVEGLAGDQ